MPSSKKLKITLVKSLIGRIPSHVTIVKVLGLGKMNSTATHNNVPSIIGMINKVNYLLKVEEV